MKKYSQEEIDEMQEAIPEWKRQAVTTFDESNLPDEKGLMGKAMRKAKSKISSSQFIQNLNQNEEFKKIKSQY
jgi:hypothetical protein